MNGNGRSGSLRVLEAAAFVESLDLPPAPRVKRGSAESAQSDIFEETRNQVMVVGSDIVSFVAGLDPKLREAIVNCSLIAQLAANRRVQDRSDVRQWYETYFDTLTHLGWATQDRGFSEHHEAGEQFEANKALLSVAAVILGPGTTAFAIVESTLNSMESMSDGPWMTIFRRESQAANAARFQVTVAEPRSDGGSKLSLMAFELNAMSTITQVLFFKFRSTAVTLRHASGQVAIDAKLLMEIHPQIAQRVLAYRRSFVEALPI